MRKISLHDLRVDTIIGAYHDERHETQPLRGFVELAGDFKTEHGIFDYATLEYAALYALRHGAFKFLEDAAEALLDIVQTMATHMHHVEHVEFQSRVQLFKPQALQSAFPSVECTRSFSGQDKLDFASWGRVVLSVTEKSCAPTLECQPESGVRLYLHKYEETPVVRAQDIASILDETTLSLSTNVY